MAKTLAQGRKPGSGRKPGKAKTLAEGRKPGSGRKKGSVSKTLADGRKVGSGRKKNTSVKEAEKAETAYPVTIYPNGKDQHLQQEQHQHLQQEQHQHLQQQHQQQQHQQQSHQHLMNAVQQEALFFRSNSSMVHAQHHHNGSELTRIEQPGQSGDVSHGAEEMLAAASHYPMEYDVNGGIEPDARAQPMDFKRLLVNVIEPIYMREQK